jgi:hypothetical protein
MDRSKSISKKRQYSTRNLKGGASPTTYEELNTALLPILQGNINRINNIEDNKTLDKFKTSKLAADKKYIEEVNTAFIEKLETAKNNAANDLVEILAIKKVQKFLAALYKFVRDPQSGKEHDILKSDITHLGVWNEIGIQFRDTLDETKWQQKHQGETVLEAALNIILKSRFNKYELTVIQNFDNSFNKQTKIQETIDKLKQGLEQIPVDKRTSEFGEKELTEEPPKFDDRELLKNANYILFGKIVNYNIKLWDDKLNELNKTKDIATVCTQFVKFLSNKPNEEEFNESNLRIKPECTLCLSQITWENLKLNRFTNIHNELIIYKKGQDAVNKLIVECDFITDFDKCIDIPQRTTETPSDQNKFTNEITVKTFNSVPTNKSAAGFYHTASDGDSYLRIKEDKFDIIIKLTEDTHYTIEQGSVKISNANLEEITKGIWSEYVKQFLNKLEKIAPKATLESYITGIATGNQHISTLDSKDLLGLVKDFFTTKETEGSPITSNLIQKVLGAASHVNLTNAAQKATGDIIANADTIRAKKEKQASNIIATQETNLSKASGDDDTQLETLELITGASTGSTSGSTGAPGAPGDTSDIFAGLDEQDGLQFGGANDDGPRLVTENAKSSYPNKAMSDVDLQGLLNIWGKIPSSNEKGSVTNFLGDLLGQHTSPYSNNPELQKIGELPDKSIREQSKLGESVSEGVIQKQMDKRLKPFRKYPDGKERYQKFVRPVTNLLLITKKLRDYHRLSVAYKQKHAEVEELVLTIRNMYYMLIFIRDQIVGIDIIAKKVTDEVGKQTDDINVLIEQITKSMGKNAAEFIDMERLNALQNRQRLLRKHRNSLTKAYEYAASSLLTRLNKIGATIHDVTNIDKRPDEYRKDDILLSPDDEGEKLLNGFENQLYKDLIGYDKSLLVQITLPEAYRDKINDNVLMTISKKMDQLLSSDNYFNLDHEDIKGLKNVSNVFTDYHNEPMIKNSPDNALTVNINKNITKNLTNKFHHHFITNNEIGEIISKVLEDVIDINPGKIEHIGGSVYLQYGGAVPATNPLNETTTLDIRFNTNTYSNVKLAEKAYNDKLRNIAETPFNQDDILKTAGVEQNSFFDAAKNYYNELKNKLETITKTINLLIETNDIDQILSAETFKKNGNTLIDDAECASILKGTNSDEFNTEDSSVTVNPGVLIKNYITAAGLTLDYEYAINQLIEVREKLDDMIESSETNSKNLSASTPKVSTSNEVFVITGDVNDANRETEPELKDVIKKINEDLVKDGSDFQKVNQADSEKELPISRYVASRHKELSMKIIASTKEETNPADIKYYVLVTNNGAQILSRSNTNINIIFNYLTKDVNFQKKIKAEIYNKTLEKYKNGSNNWITDPTQKNKIDGAIDQIIKIYSDSQAILELNPKIDVNEELTVTQNKIKQITFKETNTPANSLPDHFTNLFITFAERLIYSSNSTTFIQQNTQAGGNYEKDYIVDLGKFSVLQSGGDVVLTYSKQVDAPTPPKGLSKPRYDYYKHLHETPGYKSLVDNYPNKIIDPNINKLSTLMFATDSDELLSKLSSAITPQPSSITHTEPKIKN